MQIKKSGMKKLSFMLALVMLATLLLPAGAVFAANSVTAVSVTANGVDNVTHRMTANAGDTITIVPTATGGSSPIYEFWVKAPGAEYADWKAQTGFGHESASYAITDALPGVYDVTVYACDSSEFDGSTVANRAVTRAFIFVGSSVDISKTEFANGKMTVTATSTNMPGNVVYQFWKATAGQQDWVAFGNVDAQGFEGYYGTSNTASFDATDGTSYDLAVYAKDLNGRSIWQDAVAVGKTVKAEGNAAVTAQDLGVVFQDVVPGVFNVTIPFANAQTKLNATTDSVLIVAVQGKTALELAYNAGVMSGAGGFLKAAVQGYTQDEIKSATVTVKVPPAEVTAQDLGVTYQDVVPGVFNVTIPFADAQTKLSATTGSVLVVAVQGKTALELAYNAGVMNGAGGFLKAAVQGYTKDEISAAKVTLK